MVPNEMIQPKLLFENERVRVSDLRLQVGERIQSTLQYPTVRWQVDSGYQRGPRREAIRVDDKHVVFDYAGQACDIENVCKNGHVYRQVWFEIKKDPSRTEEEVQKVLASAVHSTDVGTELFLENRWCRVWDFYLDPDGGNPLEPHHHVLDYVFVYVAKGRLLGYSHDGKPGLFDSVNEDGDVTWFDIPHGAEADVDYAHGGKNGYADLPMREYLVELK